MNLRSRWADGVRVIGEMVRKELYQVRQDRRMLFVSIVAPIVQLVILGYAATTDIKDTNLVVCDMDRTPESRALLDRFTTSGYFVYRYAVQKPDDVDEFIAEGKASVAIVIPAGFGRMLLVQRTPQLQLLFDGADANSASILLGYATQIVTTYAQEIQLQSMTLRGARRIGRVIPEPRIWFNPDLRSSLYMVPAVVALVLMIITMTLTALGIVREKEIGTLEQLMVTPIKGYQLILGKLIPFIVVGFFDMLVVLAVAHYWFEVPLRGSLALLFGLSGLFILTTLGLGLFISTIARSQQQALLIAQFFVFMPFIFLSGFAFPIANMPEVIQYVTYVIPLRYFLEIVRGIFLRGAGMAELWPQAAAMFGLGLAVLTLSVARFRKTLE